MQNLASALAEFHKAVGPIFKQSTAQYGKYADLATVLAVVTPVLSDKGLVLTQTFMPFDSTTILRTTLLHTSGESVNSDLPMPSIEGARNALHAFGGATTYLRRYALLALLNLAAEDDDGDSWDQDSKAVAKSGTGTQTRPSRPVPAAVQSDPNALTPEAHKTLLATVQDHLQPKQKAALQQSFRKLKGLEGQVPIAEYIKTKADAAFITDWIKANTQQPVLA